MRRALDLALKGKGRVSPNPCVGCVIVKNGRVIAEGYHERYGGPHAEIRALKRAGTKIRGSTIYLTLEPCTHWGKTPPCAPELVKAGIKEAFISMKDPNPLVSGQGIRALKNARIRVHLGLEKDRAQAINRAFITWMTQKRPYVVLKTAMTMDGKIAASTGNSKWITNSNARRMGHKLRSGFDAVLIGAETAVRDNPRLTSHGQGRNPLRVVLDPHLRTPLNLTLYRDRQAKTVVFCGNKASPKKLNLLEKKGVTVLKQQGSGALRAASILDSLHRMSVSQLLIEGGGETAWPFIKEGWVDEFWIFLAPIVVGGREAKTPVEGDGFRTIKEALKFRFGSLSTIDGNLLIRAFKA